MIKIFNPIKSRRPWLPISISHLNKAFLVLGCSFFTPGVFLFRYELVETGMIGSKWKSSNKVYRGM